MTDYFGNEVIVGDSVIYMAPRYKTLSEGVINKITPHGVTINTGVDYAHNNKPILVNRGYRMIIKMEESGDRS